MNQEAKTTVRNGWNVVEEIYEDAPPGLTEANAENISRSMGLTIIEFLQAHPDQHYTFVYRVSSGSVFKDFFDDSPVECRRHKIDVAAVEYLQQTLQVSGLESMSPTALSHSALQEIGRRIQRKWLRLKYHLRRRQ